MKNLLNYAWRVFKWTFSGADGISKTVGVIALYVVGFQIPQLRWEYLAAATALLVLNATFAVWNEERKRADDLLSKLDTIKNSIPVYQVEVGVIEKFTINNLIRDYEAMLAQVRASPAHASINPFHSPFAGESREDKIERLDSYIAHLQLVDDSLKLTYKVSLKLKSNKADTNVAIKAESPSTAYVFESEDYVDNLIPRTEPPTITGVPTSWSMNAIGLENIPNIVSSTSNSPYAISEEETNLAMVNANAVYNLYDGDLFVHTDRSNVDLKITIHSTKLESPKEITVPVDLSNVTAVQVSI